MSVPLGTYDYSCSNSISIAVAKGLAGLERWRELTSRAASMRMFAGSHFYLDQSRDVLVATIASDVGSAVAGPAWA